jgi:hypothetical protein
MRRLRALLEMLGPAGVAGLGLLVFCLPFYFASVAPAERDVSRRTAAATAQRAKLPMQAVAAPEGVAELERFYRRFPTLDGLQGELEAVYAHARASRLQLSQGEYRLEKGPGLAAYRVTLPVRGSYAQLRQFVGHILKEMPTASLDALRFDRKKAGDAQVEAQVRLTIYLRPVEGKGI